MHIGLIGGIGVAATVVYYQRLTAAAAARGVQKLELTIVHGEIHELIRNNLADRRAEQAVRRKGHAHEPKPGKHWHRQEGADPSNARDVRALPPAIPKRATQHKVPFSKFSLKGRSQRREVEGDELSLTIRLRPEMRNEEVVVLKGYGAKVDGPWQTRSVTHRLGSEPAKTIIECWRP